jgi:hypothetical protein
MMVIGPWLVGDPDYGRQSRQRADQVRDVVASLKTKSLLQSPAWQADLRRLHFVVNREVP